MSLCLRRRRPYLPAVKAPLADQIKGTATTLGHHPFPFSAVSRRPPRRGFFCLNRRDRSGEKKGTEELTEQDIKANFSNSADN